MILPVVHLAQVLNSILKLLDCCMGAVPQRYVVFDVLSGFASHKSESLVRLSSYALLTSGCFQVAFQVKKAIHFQLMFCREIAITR